MSPYEWITSVPWYWWVIGDGIKSYFVANILITHRRIKAERAVSPYIRHGLITLIIGYSAALPIKLSKYIRERCSAIRHQEES